MVKQDPALVHNNYFLILVSDIERVARYIAYEESNFQTYSIESARLLLAASSEVDVVLK